MRHILTTAQRFAGRRPGTVAVLLALITLGVDSVTVPEIRFPLLYVVPVGLAAWLGKQRMAYTLAALLPLVRVVFENLWHLPESLPREGLNAFVEALALCLYVHLVGKQAGQSMRMKSTITTRDEEMQNFRAFTRMMGTTLQGRGISPGLADGVAMIHQPGPSTRVGEEHIAEEEVEAEERRFTGAVAAAIDELTGLRARAEIVHASGEGAMLEMRLAMLRDPTLARNCNRRILEDRLAAEAAVIAEIEQIEQGMQGFKQELMRARAADVRDVGLQILRQLESDGTGVRAHELASLPPGSVVVADDLLLCDALRMDPVNVVAIVTERTGPASHVAMLARARGIPAVCDISDAMTLLGSGDLLLVDADMGTVTVAPTPTQAERFALRKSRAAPRVSPTARGPALPCVTRDGVKIGLHANIGRPDEAVIALEHHLDGVGLFRSEFLFLHCEAPPDLEAQTAAYSEVAAMMRPLPVVIRTMDLGGDKLPRFGGAARDAAARIGLRGLAYSLAETTMFRTQILAIVRAASEGVVSMMFPMVMGLADLSEARSLVGEAIRGEPKASRIPIGAMIETPAAVLDINRILPIADFVSIGTNDLAHSILAMDRGSAGDPGLSAFLHPSVLRATDAVVRAANKHGKPVSVCGEAACEPATACLLIGMGVRNLSINPFLATRVRHAVRNATLGQMRAVARDALGARTRTEVQGVLASAYRGEDR